MRTPTRPVAFMCAVAARPAPEADICDLAVDAAHRTSPCLRMQFGIRPFAKQPAAQNSLRHVYLSIRDYLKGVHL